MKQNKEQVVGVKELADWLALTPRRLQQLTKRGIVPRSERGRYLLKESIQHYLWYLRGGEDKPDITDWRLGFAKLDFSEFNKKEGNKK